MAGNPRSDCERKKIGTEKKWSLTLSVSSPIPTTVISRSITGQQVCRRCNLLRVCLDTDVPEGKRYCGSNHEYWVEERMVGGDSLSYLKMS
jgi:hypothetical protein